MSAHRRLHYGIPAFFKLVLAACGKGLILNGLVCYKRHKEAASSTWYPAVYHLKAAGSLWSDQKSYPPLSAADSSWFLSKGVSPIPTDFRPPPLHSNFFNLWKWSTAWLASLEDLPTPTLTQKYLLPSQCFGSRPSVFILHSSVWRVEGTDLALLFIVLLRRF